MARSPHRLSQQRGAALVVGLVLLMVLTVLAISVMRTATLDLTMTGNAQYRENAFQLADSGLEAVIRAAETGGLDLNTLPPCPAAPRPWPDAALAWSAPVEVADLRGRYQTRACLEGETVDGPGSAVLRFRQIHYRVEARGRTNQRDAEAIHARGFYREVEN